MVLNVANDEVAIDRFWRGLRGVGVGGGLYLFMQLFYFQVQFFDATLGDVLVVVPVSFFAAFSIVTVAKSIFDGFYTNID